MGDDLHKRINFGMRRKLNSLCPGRQQSFKIIYESLNKKTDIAPPNQALIVWEFLIDGERACYSMAINLPVSDLVFDHHCETAKHAMRNFYERNILPPMAE